jgi:arsenate reductase (thioredoxin)
MKPKVVVLCTGNSCRSQMAEGFLRHYARDRYDIGSAGTEPKEGVHPLAIQVMKEAGIDISRQHPKKLSEAVGGKPIRHLIIVCGEAEASCPRSTTPNVTERHFWPFDDPAQLAGSAEEKLDEFRRVRDQIRRRVVEWLK